MDIFNSKGMLDLSNCTNAEVDRLTPEKREAFLKVAADYDTNFAAEAAVKNAATALNEAIEALRAERAKADQIAPISRMQNVRDFIASEAATAAARRG